MAIQYQSNRPVHQHECKNNGSLFNGLCWRACPPKTYRVSDSTSSICSECHYTCETCSGPTENECITCQADEVFVNSRCILQSLAWQILFSKWHIAFTVLLFANLLVLIVGAVYFIIRPYRQKRYNKFEYSPIGYSTNSKKTFNEERANLCEAEGSSDVE